MVFTVRCRCLSASILADCPWFCEDAEHKPDTTREAIADVLVGLLYWSSVRIAKEFRRQDVATRWAKMDAAFCASGGQRLRVDGGGCSTGRSAL